MDEAVSMAHRVAEHGPAATQAAKRLLRRGHADQIRAAMVSELEETRRLSQAVAPFTMPQVCERPGPSL